MSAVPALTGLLSPSLTVRSHDTNDGAEFDERRTGLDHLEFIVPTPADVAAWACRLDDLGIPHSCVKSFAHTAGVTVTFGDPDNIQLEFYALKQPRGR
jgi:glyoxylase I family protein